MQPSTTKPAPSAEQATHEPPNASAPAPEHAAKAGETPAAPAAAPVTDAPAATAPPDGAAAPAAKPSELQLLDDSGQVVADGKDRRKHPRIACKVKVHLLEVNEYGYVGSPNIAECIDLSIGGVGVLSRRPYNEGTRMLIIIAPDSKKSRKLRFGTVRQARYSGGARYHVGLQFCEAFEGKNITRWLTQNWVE